MDDYDILVIGAGPGACSFARNAPDTLRILLIDGEAENGKVCAGLLSPDAQAHLAKENISLPGHLFSSPQLFRVRTHDLTTCLTRDYPRSYLNMDRAAFDAYFKSRLPDNCHRVKGRCTEIIRTNEGFSVTYLTPSGEQHAHARLLVGADGGGSLTRRRLFPTHPLPTLTAIQAWYDSRNTSPFYSCLFDHTTSPSCSWIFFKEDALIFGGAFETKGCQAAFEAQKRKCIEQGLLPPHVAYTPARTEACLVAMPHKPFDLFLGKDGAFLVGEAAGLISPSSLEGISYALESGAALGKAITNIGLHPARLHRRYRKLLRPLMGKVVLRMLKRCILCSPFLRTCILKSGICSLPSEKDKMQEKEAKIAK